MTDAPQEVERKYLVARQPEHLASYPHKPIRQGYLAVTPDGDEVRLRRIGEAHVLTVKRGRGRVRTEIEVALTPAQFDQLWPGTEGRRLEKVRYALEEAGQAIELDVYEGPLEGFVTVEVEFDAPEACEAFHPPPWFGPEVTDDERYRNQQLALHGLPPDAQPFE